tara:strand:- start:37 stop:333 length:297 start_codon:yes stop_codon:yes gene_type:complete
MGKVANGFIITFSVLNLIATSAIIFAIYMAYVKAREAVPKLEPLLTKKITEFSKALSTNLGSTLDTKIQGVTTSLTGALSQSLTRDMKSLEDKMDQCR